MALPEPNVSARKRYYRILVGIGKGDVGVVLGRVNVEMVGLFRPPIKGREHAPWTGIVREGRVDGPGQCT